jgi:hypothetical protein
MPPTITGTSGTLSHGSTITISGSGFGSKSPFAPMVWDDCEGTNPLDKWSGAWPDTQDDPNDVIGYRASGHRGVATPHARSTKYLSGAHSSPWDAGNAGWNVMVWKNWTKGTYPTYSYWNLWVRDDPNFIYDDNYKFYDFSAAGEPYNPQNWYDNWGQTGEPDPSVEPRVYPGYHFNDDGYGESVNVPTLEEPFGDWYGGTVDTLWNAGWRKLEYVIKWSSVSRDGYIKTYENGAEMHNLATITDAYTGTDRSEAIGGFARAGNSANNTRYFDDIYFDHGPDALARVVIGDASTYAACTIREMQIPQSWGSNSITVTVNQGAHSSLTGKYLYVLDRTDTPNSAGFALTGGSGGGIVLAGAIPSVSGLSAPSRIHRSVRGTIPSLGGLTALSRVGRSVRGVVPSISALTGTASSNGIVLVTGLIPSLSGLSAPGRVFRPVKGVIPSLSTLTAKASGLGPNLVTIVGSLYNPATGQKRTLGRLIIRPKKFITSGTELVSANAVTVDIPASGDLSFNLVPSGGVPYIVEFDPNPVDTATPLRLKSGYFLNSWLVPNAGPVDISSL